MSNDAYHLVLNDLNVFLEKCRSRYNRAKDVLDQLVDVAENTDNYKIITIIEYDTSTNMYSLISTFKNIQDPDPIEISPAYDGGDLIYKFMFDTNTIGEIAVEKAAVAVYDSLTGGY